MTQLLASSLKKYGMLVWEHQSPRSVQYLKRKQTLTNINPSKHSRKRSATKSSKTKTKCEIDVNVINAFGCVLINKKATKLLFGSKKSISPELLSLQTLPTTRNPDIQKYITKIYSTLQYEPKSLLNKVWKISNVGTINTEDEINLTLKIFLLNKDKICMLIENKAEENSCSNSLIYELIKSSGIGFGVLSVSNGCKSSKILVSNKTFDNIWISIIHAQKFYHQVQLIKTSEHFEEVIDLSNELYNTTFIVHSDRLNIDEIDNDVSSGSGELITPHMNSSDQINYIGVIVHEVNLEKLLSVSDNTLSDEIKRNLLHNTIIQDNHQLINKVKSQINSIHSLVDLFLETYRKSSKINNEDMDYLLNIKEIGDTIEDIVENHDNIEQFKDGNLDLNCVHLDIRKVTTKAIHTSNYVTKSKYQILNIEPTVKPFLIGDVRKLRYIIKTLLVWVRKNIEGSTNFLKIRSLNDDGTELNFIIYDAIIDNEESELKRQLKYFAHDYEHTISNKSSHTNTHTSQLIKNKILDFELIVAKKFVNLMQGNIYYTMRDNKLRLWFCAKFEPYRFDLDLAIKQYSNVLDSKRVLVLDSHKSNFESEKIISVLHTFGLSVFSCLKPKKAESFLSQHPVDLCIVNLDVYDKKLFDKIETPKLILSTKKPTIPNIKWLRPPITTTKLFNMCVDILSKPHIRPPTIKINRKKCTSIRSLIMTNANADQKILVKILNNIGCTNIELFPNLDDIMNISRSKLKKLSCYNIIIISVVKATQLVCDSVKKLNELKKEKKSYIITIVYSDVSTKEKKCLYKAGSDLVMGAPLKVKNLTTAFKIVVDKLEL